MPRRSWEPVLVTALLGCILVFGIALRLQDPLSTRALAAEDPYTHVVFTKEWMEQGYFADSFHLGTEMYPPGMHAWLAAFVPFSGLTLYEFARIGPAFLAGLGLLGLFVLGNRLAGPAAGLGAAFLAAIMPEHIFRTELLFPTAFDLALIPLWLLGFHLAITTHRVVGSMLFVGASIPLAVMHPWAVPLFAGPLALYAAIRHVRDARSGLAGPGAVDRNSLWLAGGLIVVPTAFAVASRWRVSGTGFSDFLAHVPGFGWISGVSVPASGIFLVVAVILGILMAVMVEIVVLAARVRSVVLRRVVAGVVALVAVASLPLLTRSLPPDVDYKTMLGVVALVVALAGFVAAFVRPSALGDMALSLVAFLFPLTALNFFDSPFWPQRTVAYLALGVALLGACAVAQLHALPLSLPFLRAERARRVAGPAALVAIGLLAAGTATAVPVNTYEWYRLYNDEQFRGFEEVARIVDDDPDAKVFLYGWQPALMVKTLTDPDHVWYAPKFFSDPAKRAQNLDDAPGATYVLVDRFTQRAADAGKADLAFLDDGSQYRVVLEADDGALRLYEVVR